MNLKTNIAKGNLTMLGAPSTHRQMRLTLLYHTFTKITTHSMGGHKCYLYFLWKTSKKCIKKVLTVALQAIFLSYY